MIGKLTAIRITQNANAEQRLKKYPTLMSGKWTAIAITFAVMRKSVGFQYVGMGCFIFDCSAFAFEYSAFKWCSGLTEIIIPNSVTSIENSSFWCCSELTEIIIPDSVTYIGYYAFWGCSGLTESFRPLVLCCFYNLIIKFWLPFLSSNFRRCDIQGSPKLYY